MCRESPKSNQKARLVEALRANLQRRKEQARRRAAGDPGLPAGPAEKPPQMPSTPKPSD
jgi:hypothetical protein